MMKACRTMTGYLVFASMLLGVPFDVEAACNADDEKQWEKLRDQLPTSDMTKIGIVIEELTTLHQKCDPKTRFSASVAQLLIRANFRQGELRNALDRIQRWERRQSPAYDPGGLPGKQ